MADLSLTQLPRRLQLLLFGTLLLAAAFVYYVYLETPTQQRLAERRDALASLRRKSDKDSTLARQLQEVRDEVDDLRRNLDGLRSILPGERDAANLLRQVHTLAIQSNLTIHGFRPQSATGRPLYAEWPIGLGLEGTYHDLGEFLDRVGKVPRIINISNLVIQRKQSPLAEVTVDITCTATTFVLLDDGKGAAVEASTQTAVSTVETEVPATYTYSRDGRRDPFVSLVSRGIDGRITRAIAERPDGLPGVLVDEIVVRGLVQSRGVWIAIVVGASNRAYSMRSGDRLLDGSVVSITEDAVVLLQDINDPLSRLQQREVRKYLHAKVH